MPLLSSTNFLYTLIFSCELDSSMTSGAQWQCDGGVSVYDTNITQHLHLWLPNRQMPKSSLSPGIMCSDSSFSYSWLFDDLGPHLSNAVTNFIVAQYNKPSFLIVKAC